MSHQPATALAFCPWCRHHRYEPGTALGDRCRGVVEVRPYGIVIYDVACRDHNPRGYCQEYQPSFATRLVRLVGLRRPGAAVKP